MLRLLGFSQADASPAKPPPSRGLPALWYRSQAMYELERRAIFSARWTLITHSLRFSKAGDYHTFTLGGFSFFLVQDRDGNINGFHNLCRHRAYPILEESSGTASILSCKYHGWSYGFKGNLAKAPRFDTVEGFDKSQHGLLPIHVYIDNSGFVWVNLEAGEPSAPWDADFKTEARMAQYDFDEYKYDHSWNLEVNANWKALIENYNECYHCPTSHPLIAGVSDLTKYQVEPTDGYLEHTVVNKSSEEKNLRRSMTFFYPTTAVAVTETLVYIHRMVPVTATTSRIENEVYRHKSATDERFAALNKFYHQVLEEDKALCDGAQMNLNAGVYVNGEYHPQKEKGPLYFQQTLKRHVMAHREREEKQGGREIWPAVPKYVGEMKTDKLDEEEDFCSRLDAASCMASKPDLAW